MAIIRNYRKILKDVDPDDISGATGIYGITTTVDTSKLPTIEVDIPDGTSDYDVSNVDQYMLDKGYVLVT